MSVRVRVLEEGRDRARRDRIEAGRSIRAARHASGLRMRDVGRAIGRSDAWVSRVERGRLASVSYVDLAVLASAVGLRLRLAAYPAARAIQDAPQLDLLRRLRARIGERWTWRYEVVLPDRLDQRAADAVISRPGAKVMIEAFTRLADGNRQLRAVRLKARDLGVARVVVVLRSSDANRRAVADAHEVLASEFPLSTRAVLRALGEGRDPGADGVVWL